MRMTIKAPKQRALQKKLGRLSVYRDNHDHVPFKPSKILLSPSRRASIFLRKSISRNLASTISLLLFAGMFAVHLAIRASSTLLARADVSTRRICMTVREVWPDVAGSRESAGPMYVQA